MARSTLLQTEDDGGTRRSVGAVDSSGKGAVRAVAPDSESRLASVDSRLGHTQEGS